MNYRALADELTTDPLSRGYAAMTDGQAAMSLNDTNGGGRAVTRDLVPAYEVWEAIVPATRAALTALQTETKSRAAEIGIDPPTAAHVAIARGGRW